MRFRDAIEPTIEFTVLVFAKPREFYNKYFLFYRKKPENFCLRKIASIVRNRTSRKGSTTTSKEFTNEIRNRFGSRPLFDGCFRSP
jgi:hypothetical protein